MPEEIKQQCGGCGGKGHILVERAHEIPDTNDDDEGGQPSQPPPKEYEERTCGSCGGTGWISGGSR